MRAGTEVARRLADSFHSVAPTNSASLAGRFAAPTMEAEMFRQITLCAALVTFAMVGSSLAQTGERPNDVSMPPVIEWPPEQVDQVSGIKYEILDTADFPAGAARLTHALLTDIVTWLAENFGLPAIYNHPRVELAPPMKIAAMRYKGLLPDRWREDSIYDPAVQAAHQREVVAIYNDTTKTIVLSDSWTGANPAELSVLVHEMVHHLQNLAKLKFECPAAREKPAYLAQDQWLQRYGLDLEKEFEIDKFTLLVTSACMS
jgi:hypothetical protein